MDLASRYIFPARGRYNKKQCKGIAAILCRLQRRVLDGFRILVQNKSVVEQLFADTL